MAEFGEDDVMVYLFLFLRLLMLEVIKIDE
jgi:hypothetical protein